MFSETPYLITHGKTQFFVPGIFWIEVKVDVIQLSEERLKYS